jgi:hypothetical protein
MNRIRLMVLAGLFAVSGLGLVASSAQARSGAAPASAPRYYYGWGYNGWGYYYYPTAPTYLGGFFSTPAPSYPRGSSTSRPAQDYTGRHDGLARPWLRPLR